MIRTTRLYFLLATLLAVTSLGHTQIEQRLNYCYGQGAIDRIGGLIMIFTDQVDPPDELKLPEFKANDPLFFAWKTPSTKEGCVWFAMDRSNLDQPHDRLIVDTDCDGDLSDELVVTCDPKEKEETGWTLFHSILLNFPGEGESRTYHVNAVYEAGGLGLAIGSDCCYHGEIAIGEQDYEVIFKDDNHDGTHDQLSIAPKDHPDFRSLGRFFDLNETLYSLEVLEYGSMLKLNPAKDIAMGQVQVPDGISQVRFESELGTFIRTPQGGIVALPQGTHHLSRWTIERKDQQGRLWRAEGQGFDKQGLVEVNATDIPSLKIGEPLLSTMTVNRNGGDLSFSQGLTGHMSESITLYVDGEQTEAPKLEVHDRTGKLVDTLNFEYG